MTVSEDLTASSRAAAGLPPAGEERVTNTTTGGEKCRKRARFDLLPWDCLWEVAEHYAVAPATGKYSDHNWRRGYAWSLSLGAMGRHLAALAHGEDIDPESNTPHAAAIVFHALALLWFRRAHPDLDDRYHTGGQP